MLEAFLLNDTAIKQFIYEAEYSKPLIEQKIDIHSNGNLKKLSMSYDFFNFLHKYHDNLNLTNENIEHMVLGLDDLIDEFEEYADTSKKDTYSKKASEFYDLLVKLQFDLGFYLSDRKYQL